MSPLEHFTEEEAIGALISSSEIPPLVFSASK
jgi:hypothetical protein